MNVIIFHLYHLEQWNRLFSALSAVSKHWRENFSFKGKFFGTSHLNLREDYRRKSSSMSLFNPDNRFLACQNGFTSELLCYFCWQPPHKSSTTSSSFSPGHSFVSGPVATAGNWCYGHSYAFKLKYEGNGCTGGRRRFHMRTPSLVMQIAVCCEHLHSLFSVRSVVFSLLSPWAVDLW